TIGITFYKILANFRRNAHKQVTHMSHKRKITDDGIFLLQHIDDPNNCHGAYEYKQPPKGGPKPADYPYNKNNNAAKSEKFFSVNIKHEELIEHSVLTSGLFNIFFPQCIN